MRRSVAAWCVQQGLAFALLLSGSSAAVARPPVFFALATSQASAQTSSATAPSTSATASSTGAQVIMKAVSYRPAELTVRAGQTVEFKNEDIFAHTVTADDGSFDSGLIQPGSSWKLTMPNTSVSFHCRPHPNMKGRLVLASAPAPEKSTSRGLPGFNPPRGPHEFHPILVNFTAALLPLALLSDLLGRVFKRASLHNTAAWMVLYAALITPLTGAAGWWWKSQVGRDLPPNLITLHQWLGTSLALMFIILAVWRWRIQKRGAVPDLAYLAVTTITVLALIYQGSVGGLMVFGK